MSESLVRKNLTESQLADLRSVALGAVNALLSDRKYLLLVVSHEGVEKPSKVSDLVSDDAKFEIRDFPDTDPDSLEAVRPSERTFPVWRDFVRYAIDSGLLTLTVVGEGHTRFRLTLNRNVAGNLLTGNS